MQTTRNAIREAITKLQTFYATERVPTGAARAVGMSTHVAHGFREIRIDLYWLVVFVSLPVPSADARECSRECT